MLTDSERQTLSGELDTDPDGLGYAAPISEGNHAEVKRLANEVRADYSVLRSSIPMGEFYGRVDWTDEVGPLSTELSIKLMLLTSTPTLDGSSATIRDALVAIFGSGSNTVAAFDDVRSRDASRAEDLFGEGVSVTLTDIRAAREV